MTFTDRWLRLAAAARQAPVEPLPTLDVDRVLAARRPPPRIIRIGWFPPGLAAAAMLACAGTWAAGFDPRPALTGASMFLADLPQQVPHSPAVPVPFEVPSASALVASVADFMPTPVSAFSPVSTGALP